MIYFLLYQLKARLAVSSYFQPLIYVNYANELREIN